MKLLLIFNPNASSGRAARLLPQIRAGLERFSRLSVEVTRSAGHAMELAADANLEQYDGLLAAGGDGTLFEVLNGLYRQHRSIRPPLGVIPVGTGNAFARDLGLMPGDWRKAIEIIASGSTRPFDVGRVDCAGGRYHFLNIVGMGFPVDAMITAARLKRIGRAAYSIAVIRELLRLRSYDLEVEIDGRPFRQDNVFLEISNTRFTGTSFLMAPDARPDDGLFDVTLLRRTPRLRLFRLFPSIYSGRHVEFEEVTTFRAREIRILSPRHSQLVPDGEFYGETPATVACLRQDLKIFCPIAAD